ncbi:MAG: hypothetical protein ABH843_05810 [Candidatus Omnitrophota bacterium]
MRKTISLLLIISIVITNSHCYGYPTLFKTKSHAQRYLQDEDQELLLDIVDSPSSINLPQKLGRVVESHKGKGDSLVMHIQDRHADPTAQLNIAGIIDEFVTRHDAQLICLEGASKELDTSFYDRFPDNSIKKKTSKFFLQKGVFTGAEYYKITNKDKYIRAQGVEDKRAYLEHLSIYKSNGIDKDDILGFLKAISVSLNSLKEEAYSKDLKSLDKTAISYYFKQIKLPEYLKALEAYSKKTRYDIAKYENLSSFIELVDREGKIDFKKAEEQRETVIKELSDSLKEADLDALIDKSLEFRLGNITQEEFYDYLYVLIEKEKIDKSKYKDLAAYADYIRFSKSINYLAVFDEAEELEEEVKLSLCKTDIQKDIVVYSKAVDILKDLYNFKLTRRQLDYMEVRADFFDVSKIQSFLKTASTKYGLNLNPIVSETHIDQYAIDRSRKYYQVALKRDIALMDNTLGSMERDRKDKAILITGGFHTEGITNILKEKDISYVVICPNIGAEDYEELYTARMAGKLPDITELAEFFHQTLVAPLVTADMSRTETAGQVKAAFAALVGLSQDKQWDSLSSAEQEDILLEIWEALAQREEDMLYLQDIQEIIRETRAVHRSGGDKVVIAKAASSGKAQRPIVDTRVDKNMAQEWINAQPTEELKRLAEFIVKNIIYVDQETFEITISKAVEQLKNQHTRNFAVCLLGSDSSIRTQGVKSNSWVLQLAKEKGLPQPAGVVAGDSSMDAAISMAKWLLKNEGVSDIVFVDDASYSGAQIYDWLVNLAMNISEEERLRSKKITIHLIIPFMTTKAYRLLTELGSELTIKRGLNIEIDTINFEKIPIFQEMVENLSLSEQNELLASLDKAYGSSSREKTLFYFQHKQPDYRSVVSPGPNKGTVLEGPVMNDEGSISYMPFMPIIGKTPYQEGYLDAVRDNIQNTQWASRITTSSNIAKTSSAGEAENSKASEFMNNIRNQVRMLAVSVKGTRRKVENLRVGGLDFKHIRSITEDEFNRRLQAAAINLADAGFNTGEIETFITEKVQGAIIRDRRNPDYIEGEYLGEESKRLLDKSEQILKIANKGFIGRLVLTGVARKIARHLLQFSIPDSYSGDQIFEAAEAAVRLADIGMRLDKIEGEYLFSAVGVGPFVNTRLRHARVRAAGQMAVSGYTEDEIGYRIGEVPNRFMGFDEGYQALHDMTNMLKWGVSREEVDKLFLESPDSEKSNIVRIGKNAEIVEESGLVDKYIEAGASSQEAQKFLLGDIPRLFGSKSVPVAECAVLLRKCGMPHQKIIRIILEDLPKAEHNVFVAERIGKVAESGVRKRLLDIGIDTDWIDNMLFKEIVDKYPHASSSAANALFGLAKAGTDIDRARDLLLLHIAALSTFAQDRALSQASSEKLKERLKRYQEQGVERKDAEEFILLFIAEDFTEEKIGDALECGLAILESGEPLESAKSFISDVMTKDIYAGDPSLAVTAAKAMLRAGLSFQVARDTISKLPAVLKERGIHNFLAAKNTLEYITEASENEELIKALTDMGMSKEEVLNLLLVEIPLKNPLALKEIASALFNIAREGSAIGHFTSDEGGSISKPKVLSVFIGRIPLFYSHVTGSYAKEISEVMVELNKNSGRYPGQTALSFETLAKFFTEEIPEVYGSEASRAYLTVELMLRYGIPFQRIRKVLIEKAKEAYPDRDDYNVQRRRVDILEYGRQLLESAGYRDLVDDMQLALGEEADAEAFILEELLPRNTSHTKKTCNATIKMLNIGISLDRIKTLNNTPGVMEGLRVIFEKSSIEKDLELRDSLIERGVDRKKLEKVLFETIPAMDKDRAADNFVEAMLRLGYFLDEYGAEFINGLLVIMADRIPLEQYFNMTRICGSLQIGLELLEPKKILGFLDAKDDKRRLDTMLQDRYHDPIFASIKAFMDTLSDEEKKRFINNILMQVPQDKGVDSNGEVSHTQLHQIVNMLLRVFGKDWREKIMSSDIDSQVFKALRRELLEESKAFDKWSQFKRLRVLANMISHKKLLAAIDKYQDGTERGEKLYAYYEFLILHSAMEDSEALRKMILEPEEFLGLGDANTPQKLHDAKKPSRLLELNYIDLNARELIDGLILGYFDDIQVIKPYRKEIGVEELDPAIGRLTGGKLLDYLTKSGYAVENGLRPVLSEYLSGSLGPLKRRLAGLEAGRSRSALAKQIELVEEVIVLLNNDAPFNIIINRTAKFRFDAEALKRHGLSLPVYAISIIPKSDPQAIMTGSEAPSCMAYGSGKNNIYVFNLNTAFLALSKEITGENGKKRDRILATSVITLDRRIPQMIPAIVKAIENAAAADKLEELDMEELLGEDFLDKVSKEAFISADNVEAAPSTIISMEAGGNFEDLVRVAYRKFFTEYLKRYPKTRRGRRINRSKILIGIGYSDFLTNLETEEDNHYVMQVPGGYSDKTGDKIKVLNLDDVEDLAEEKLINGIQPLSYEDLLEVSFIENKAFRDAAYKSNIAGIEMELMAATYNENYSRAMKGDRRKNLSLGYFEEGKLQGYIIAYVGFDEATGKEIIYISDYAAAHKRGKAGGALLKALFANIRDTAQIFKEKYDTDIKVLFQATKTEDGSFRLFMPMAGDDQATIERKLTRLKRSGLEIEGEPRPVAKDRVEFLLNVNPITKTSSAGSVEEVLLRAAASLSNRPHPLLETSDTKQNLRDKIEALERTIGFSGKEEERLRLLIKRYFELERMVHRIKRDYITKGRIRLLSAANWTIFSHKKLQSALQPIIWSEAAIPGEGEYDFLSMYGIGAGLETAADHFFGSHESVSLNLEGFDRLDGRQGSDFQYTGIAIVYSKKLEEAIQMIAVDAPDEDYLIMTFSDFLGSEEKAQLKKEVLDPDGLRDLKEEMIVRRGMKIDTLPFLDIQQGPFNEREVMMPDGVLSDYIEAIVVDDDVYDRFISVNENMQDKVVRASEYFSASNERLAKLISTREEIIKIVEAAPGKASSAGTTVEEVIKSLTSLGASWAEYLQDVGEDPIEYAYDDFGPTPRKYGLIIYDRILRGAEEEKNILKALAKLRASRGAKFEIVVSTTEEREDLIEKWGISADNVRTTEEFLAERKVSFAGLSENEKVIAVAGILRKQMPVGIVAAPDVYADKLAGEINRSREDGEEYVFVTSQTPVDVMIDGYRVRSFVVSEMAIADVLHKLRNYEEIVIELEALSTEQQTALLFEILPAVNDQEKITVYIQKLEISAKAASAGA